MKVAVLVTTGAQASVAVAVGRALGADVVGVAVAGGDEGSLRAAAAAMGIDQVAAAIDPALAGAGPRQSGHVLAPLLQKETITLLLIDADAERGEGVLAAAAAHHLSAAVLLGADEVKRAGRDGAETLAVRLALAGRHFQLELEGPAVIVLAPDLAATPAPAPLAPEAVTWRARDLKALDLRPQDLVEPAPPATARPGQMRPTPIKDLTQLLT